MTLELTQLYKDLEKAYDAVLDRRRFLSDRAGTLLGFNGLAATILAGFAGGSRSVSTPLLSALIAAALASYAGSAVFAVVSIREHRWYVAPSIPQPSEETLEEFFKDPSKLPMKGFALQILKATQLNSEENWRKYYWLNLGYCLLALAVVISAVVGLLTVIRFGALK